MWVRWYAATLLGFGFGYSIAAHRPYRYWPFIAVGLIIAVLRLMFFLWAAAEGPWQLSDGWVVVVNDVIWMPPLGFLLFRVWERMQDLSADDGSSPGELDPHSVLANTYVEPGLDLLHLTYQNPVLLVFLRHFGCTFCRQTLQDLARERRYLGNRGVAPILIHMSDPEHAEQFFGRYGLDDLYAISDPSKRLYRAFGLVRGRFRQLFGPKVLFRGFKGCFLEGHGVGWLDGDGFQMPGVFLLQRGEIVAGFRHLTPADRPNYQHLAACAFLTEERAL